MKNYELTLMATLIKINSQRKISDKIVVYLSESKYKVRWRRMKVAMGKLKIRIKNVRLTNWNKK